MRTLRFTIAALLVAALAAAPSAAGALSLSGSTSLNWPAYLPAVPGDFTASTEQDCPPGSIHCVDNVIREMTRRWERLGCDHDAVFSLVYLRTTEEYREAAATPGFFDDAAFVNHEDAVFAEFYFRAVDAWNKGRIEEVPPAWRIALHASDERSVKGMGDILLGMNAHINRDLPFVLNAIGMTAEDGTSRKADHDRVNEVLNEVATYVLFEAAERYDPTIDDGDVPGTTIDQQALMAMVQGWREAAWRKAEMLRDAGSEAELLDVAQMIEDEAALEALTIRTLYAYDGYLTDTTARDAHCEEYLAND